MSTQAELNRMQFFITPEHDCSYLPGRRARTLFLDPRETVNSSNYSSLAEVGFRRSGSHLYRPHCNGCKQCIPVRIPVQQFTLKRRYRRLMKLNQDLEFIPRSAGFDPDVYRLYEAYITHRHADGDMFPPSPEQFRSFLLCPWSNNFFGCLYQGEKLVAVAVTDRLQDGLSAIYTFYDTTEPRRALGVYSVLQQIEQCRRLGLEYLYLGYWVPGCQKMAYKADYRPLQRLVDNKWEPVLTEKPTSIGEPYE